jgi:hypothetical protein
VSALRQTRAESGAQIDDAIERFANKLAAQPVERAKGCSGTVLYVLLETANAVAEAGKSRRTLRRDHRTAQGKGE